jgi:hypothetical protein
MLRPKTKDKRVETLKCLSFEEELPQLVPIDRDKLCHSVVNFFDHKTASLRHLLRHATEVKGGYG